MQMRHDPVQTQPELQYGYLYRRDDAGGRPAAVARLCNERSLDHAIRCGFNGYSYLTYYTQQVHAIQAALTAELRDAGVDLLDTATSPHFQSTTSVGCSHEHSCVHRFTDDEILRLQETADEDRKRTVIACDPAKTRLRDDCMECFPRRNELTQREELVVRVHLYYPNSMPCMCVHDRRARLVTQKHFVPRDARTAQGYHLFHYTQRSAGRSAAVPVEESMFPYTPKADESSGFTLELKCTAVTVETVFVRDAAPHQQQQPQQRPRYAEDAEQTRVYFSYLRPTAFVTDDELADHLPAGTDMPAFSDDRDVEKYHVLQRLYLLAHDQGWTTTPPARCPRPPPHQPVLYRRCASEVDVVDRRDRRAPALLRQSLTPDPEAHITRFCFRRIVSEALRTRVVAAARADPHRHVPVVCYMPHGARQPAFTDAQVAALQRLYPALGIRRPATRRDWGRLSQTLYQHGVALLDILAAIGAPLRDADGAVVDSDALVPYTADMADDFFLVVVNRPLRDYTCAVNQRWLREHLALPGHRPAASARVFAAWVRYWDAMVQLRHTLDARAEVDVVSAQLGLRLPAGVPAECGACLVNGRVTDDDGGLVFAELGGRTFRDAAHAGSLLPGTSVLYRFWLDGELKFEPVESAEAFVRALPTRKEAMAAAANKAEPDSSEAALAASVEGVEGDGAACASGGPQEAAAAVGLFLQVRRTGLSSLGYGTTLRNAAGLLPTRFGAEDGALQQSTPPRSPSPPPSPSQPQRWGKQYDDSSPARARAGGRGRGAGEEMWPPVGHRSEGSWRGAGSRGSGGRGRGARRAAEPRSEYDVDDEWDSPSYSGGARGGAGAGAPAPQGREDCYYDPNYQPPSLHATPGGGAGRGRRRGW